MTQTITALFDNQTDAEAAKAKLVSAGIPQSAIRVLAGTQGTTRTSSAYDHRRDEGGFWQELKDFFLPEEDRYSYSEGLSRGGTMLTVTTEQTQANRVYDILEESGSIDLEEREAAWRKEGWSGYTATGASTSGAAGTAAYTTGEHSTAGSERDETIPVVEERLNVGKRVREHGRVRIRSYAIETPVNEQVTLREESVHVERRPVDRATTAADERLFEERTIEATERAEEAVVSKEARVVEEVGLRKEADQRTETIQDSVRRTEVEVEDERGNVTRTGTTDTERR